RQFADFFNPVDALQSGSAEHRSATAAFLAPMKRQFQLRFAPLFMAVARYAPDSWLSEEPLIDQARLKEIQDYYQADWQACNDYVAEQNRLLGLEPQGG
ncbi:MAG: hypothetical protein HKN85_01805, partial [Gammaproteobacteria bacterium]|nr:hypothetical protein [Gammaproteobacteria bacterium]